MEFRNHTKEKFEWDTGDDLYGMIDTDTEIHPEIATELPGVILEEYNLGPVTAVETETLHHNDINAAAYTTTDTVTGSGITYTPGVWNERGTTIPITEPINPIPETHINEELDDDNEVSENEYESVEEIETQDADTS